jgi:hypothetical protein
MMVETVFFAWAAMVGAPIVAVGAPQSRVERTAIQTWPAHEGTGVGALRAPKSWDVASVR